jgi:hypothetical protein
VDRKFRMTPKMQRMILKVKEMTFKKQSLTPRMVKMTPKMTPRTELLQLFYKRLTMTQWRSMILRWHQKIKNDTLYYWSKLLKDCMGLNKRLLWKRKFDGIPYLWKSYFSLLLRSKKSILWHFSETPSNR